MLPKITIITPSYNQAQYLEQTIDSVLSQRYERLEYMVIDGGSKDESPDIIKKYERYLSYWTSESDNGQSHAINKGLKKATGEITNWLNSDDYLQPGSLAVIANAFQDPAINVISGRSNIIKDGKVIQATKGTDLYPGNLPKTLGCARIDQPETYFRKKILDQLGPLDESLHYVMDKEFWMRYLVHFGTDGIMKIQDVLANFRWHSDSKTKSNIEGFEIETNALMYQLAMTNHNYVKANIIKTHLKIHINEIEPVRSTFKTNTLIIDQALDYFLLNKADEAYYNHNHALCRKILSTLDIKKFDSTDQILYAKLNLRSRYLPVWIKKLMR